MQSQIRVGMVFLADADIGQQLGLAEIFRANGMRADWNRGALDCATVSPLGLFAALSNVVCVNAQACGATDGGWADYPATMRGLGRRFMFEPTCQACSIPLVSMKAITWSRPTWVFKLVMTKGLSPLGPLRMRVVSAAITPRSAPT